MFSLGRDVTALVVQRKKIVAVVDNREKRGRAVIDHFGRKGSETVINGQRDTGTEQLSMVQEKR